MIQDPEASVRINIDVRNAQTALFDTKADGTLKAENLNAVNALLVK
jgi:hypothetical protein